MGTVFKKQTTRPLPVGAELFTKSGQRYARWKPKKGKTRTAKVTTGQDGSERIVTESPKWLAKFRDGQGIVCEVSTGCKDETAARAMLAALEKRAERVASGIITTSEDAMTIHQHTPLTEHVAEFISDDASGRTVKDSRQRNRAVDSTSHRRSEVSPAVGHPSRNGRTLARSTSDRTTGQTRDGGTDSQQLSRRAADVLQLVCRA